MLPLMITLNPGSRLPMYEQLYAAVAAAIRNGDLRHREKLPSKRELCSHLGVSRSTVEATRDSSSSPDLFINKKIPIVRRMIAAAAITIPGTTGYGARFLLDCFNRVPSFKMIYGLYSAVYYNERRPKLQDKTIRKENFFW